jgi:hypothetical protein
VLVPLLVSTSVIALPLEALLPDTVPDTVDVHVKAVPETPELNARDADEPLQTDEVDGVATAIGFGLTVTTLVAVLPLHKLAVGVTV